MTRRATVAIAVAVFLVLTILVIAMSPHKMRRMQAGFLDLISPFLKTGSTVEKKYRDYREGLKTLEQLEEENKLLTIANKELSATNQTLRGLESENNRLRNALGYRERAVFKLKPARIIARDPATWYSQIVIDRGSADEIREDMPVLTEEGLVGKTTVVGEHSSEVVLISDESCRVAVKVEGTREQGIVKGERSSSNVLPAIGLSFLSKDANLKPGMKVYTSGIGGVFPAGVFAGQVKDFKVRDLDGYATIVPAVDLTTIEDVFVVVSREGKRPGK
jgi:rod shape-determining protein MreC